MKRIGIHLLSLLVILTTIVSVFLPVNPALAGTETYNHIIPFTITDTSGVARTNLPVIIAYDVNGKLIAYGLTNATTTDTYVDSTGAGNSPVGSGTAYDYMMQSGNITAIIPSLPAFGSVTLNLYTGYSPVQTSFPIITGVGGSIATVDDPALEFSDNFTSEFVANVDTSAGALKDLLHKPGAIKTYVSAASTITSEIYGLNAQMLYGGYNDALYGAATEYNAVMGGAVWSATESDVYEVVPSAGSISKLYVRLSTNIAAGATGIFTLMLNGAPSALTCTVVAGASTASDTTHSVALAAGDLISIRATYTGVPGVPIASWSTAFIPTTADKFIFMTNGLDHVALSPYIPTQGNMTVVDATEANSQYPMPTAGTFSKMYVKTSGVPGGGGVAITLRLNGANTALTCTVAGAATTASDLANTVAVVAGGLIDQNIAVATNATRVAISMVFDPTTTGESVIMGGQRNPATGAVNYLHLSGTASELWNATESNVYNITQYSELSKLYVHLAVAPAGATSYTFSIRDSSGTSGDSGLTVTITGAATTGNDTTHTYTTVTSSTTDMRSTPAGGVPAATNVKWGVVNKGYQVAKSVSATPIASGEHTVLTTLNDPFDVYLTLDGVAGSYIECGTTVDAGITNQVSLESWVEPVVNLAASTFILGLVDEATPAYDLGFYVSTPAQALSSYVANTLAVEVNASSGINLVIGTWYYIVVTYDGANVQMYVNGVPAGAPVALNGNLRDSAVNFTYGQWNLRPANYSYGDTRLYARALGAAEIAANFALGRINRPVPTNLANILMWHHFDDAIGNDVNDYSGGGHSGAVSSDGTWYDENFRIYVDGVLKDSEPSLGLSVPDNANTWYFGQNNVMPYINSIKFTVGGTEVLWYQPNAMISGTALPDRDTADGTQNGVITWGTNTSITITAGDITTSLSATSVGVTSAMMQGELFYIGTFASVYLSFQYGLDTTYGYSTTESSVAVAGSISVSLTGLTPNTTYHYRAIARSGVVYAYGADITFITAYSSSSMGSTTPLIMTAGVFSGYSVTGDLLFCAEIINTYPPYYPTKNPANYFQMQLIGTDNSTKLGASPIVQWGDRPESIYLNPTVVTANITYGAAYFIKVINISSETITVTTSYTLTPSDWYGNDLTKLDEWCIGVATRMQGTDGTILTNPYTEVITDYGVVITNAAGGYFTKGIHGIAQVRPNLFSTAEHKSTVSTLSSTVSLDAGSTLAGRVGATISGDANTVAGVFGITGQQFLMYVILAVILMCIVITVSSTQGFGALGALCLAIPIIGASAYFKILEVVVPTILFVVFLFLFVRQFIWKTL